MKLSVAIATHNEEANIKKCLAAVYDWADEIVVADGESTDKTVETITDFEKTRRRPADASALAGKQGSGEASKIQIFHEKNPPMFHINKQKALEKCTGDWILQLDADEIVSPELKEEIQNVILRSTGDEGSPANAGSSNPASLGQAEASKLRDSSSSVQNDKSIAYWIPRLNYFLGRPLKKGGQYPDYTIRLYRNGVAHFPCKSVHEQVAIDTSMVILSDPPAGGESKDPIEIATPSARNDKKTDSAEPDSVGSDSVILNESEGSPAHADSSNKTRDSSLITQNDNEQIGYLKTNLLHLPYPTFSDYLTKWRRYSKLEAELLREKGVKPSVTTFVRYVVVEPTIWFLKTYFRHKGFMDGLAGFVFSLMSALRFWQIYKNL